MAKILTTVPNGTNEIGLAMERGEIEGSGTPLESLKSYRADWVREGKIRVLVTKPSIAGFGMNWQHCRNVAFVGLSDSWEQYYQAKRRVWRFGQKRPVTCNIITASTEGAVVENILRKEADADLMMKSLCGKISATMQRNLRSSGFAQKYKPENTIQIPSFL